MPKLKLLLILSLIPFLSRGNSVFDCPLDSLVAEDTLVISQIVITGNKITKLSVISRELFLHEGDTVNKAVLDWAIDRTRENLMNTALFNFVNIQHQKIGPGQIVVIVDVTERWYIIPLPIFELVDRNFNEWIKSGDISRVNLGFYLNWDNFRGRNEALKFQFKWGYSQKIGISYSLPFINKNQEEGLTFSGSYSRNREVGYKVEESKVLLFKDEENFVRKEIFGGFKYTQRRGFYTTSSFSFEYRNNSIEDTIAALNPDFLGNGNTVQQLITIAWQFRHDRRDFKVYALKGYLFDFEIVKNGIGILENEPDLLYLSSTIKYFKPVAPRWFFSSALKGKLSGQSEAPYFNQRGFGYANDLIRSYEFYVVPGQNFVLSRNTFKFALVPTQIISLPFSILEKFRTIPYAFYLNANFDFGYVRDRQFQKDNPLANEWQYGYGFGLDYVTYYNMVFRLEYSFNKFGENGFFLHFTAPI
ncbi:MAG: hypothetical protein IPP71_16755 [Bacteroidetes bacterium]|nr:hypothetical protein [Bacteroidota bacterium]